MNSAAKRDLTTGSVLKTVIYFSLPFLLSYFLQTLYGMADLFIIGQYNAVESTTAVSIGSQVMHMITVMIVGLSMGTTVMIGRAIGAKNNRQVSVAVGNTITLFVGLSVAFMILFLLAVKPIVAVMSTPAEAVAEVEQYLTICFIGIPFITAYNIISSIFRGMGDSKSPMYFIAVACAANIALDYLFIGGFKLGAAGAALGTTLSQTISVITALIYIKRKKGIIKISRKDLKPNGETMKMLLKIGLPIAVQDGFIQVAFIVLTVIANLRGLNDAAAVGIVEKIICMLFLVPSSMLSTVSALSAQNIGAGKYDRARLVLRYAVCIAGGFGLTVSIIMRFAAQGVVGLFTDSDEVVRLGAQYMHGYVWDCLLAGIHFSFSGFFCAYNMSIISFIHNAASILCARIPLAYIASKMFPYTLFPMGVATATGSALSVLICVAVYIYFRKTKKIE